jgi:hypothetical protein
MAQLSTTLIPTRTTRTTLFTVLYHTGARVKMSWALSRKAVLPVAYCGAVKPMMEAIYG